MASRTGGVGRPVWQGRGVYVAGGAVTERRFDSTSRNQFQQGKRKAANRLITSRQKTKEHIKKQSQLKTSKKSTRFTNDKVTRFLIFWNKAIVKKY